MNRAKIGIILLNLGGPDSLKAVKPFLYNLFSDRLIIRLGPSFMQKIFALIISSTRAKTVEKYYEKIGGKSPILEITTQQAEALENSLNSNEKLNITFKVYIGMRYWHPLIEETVDFIYKDGIKRLLAIPLYPQYSVTTSGSSINTLENYIKKYPIELITVKSWYNHPIYIEALTELIKAGLKKFNKVSNLSNTHNENVTVLFSAHSLPQKFIKDGDPYLQHILETINLITKSLEIKWNISFQSKTGPVKWLEPATEDMIIELSKKGVKNILIVPISFVSDHIETLYEIDILYKELAFKHGINLVRTESLNTNQKFIKTLQDIVIKNVTEAGWLT